MAKWIAQRSVWLAVVLTAVVAWPALAAEDEDVQPDLNALRAKAETGSVKAQTQLADLCIASDDFTNAVVWYRKAAEQGDLTAQLSLASLLLAGRGTAKNPQEAAKWLRAAADRIEGPASVGAAATNVAVRLPTNAIIIGRTNPPIPPPVPAKAIVVVSAPAPVPAPEPTPAATNPPANTNPLARVQRAGVANVTDPSLQDAKPVVRPPREPR